MGLALPPARPQTQLLAAVPVAMATVATLVRPAAWQWFVGGSMQNYSISPEGWRQLVDSRR